MPKIKYVAKRFSPDVLKTIAKANEVIEEYAAAGYDMSLRQLYYVFVKSGLIRNEEREYKRLGNILSDARLAGLVDWERIRDNLRLLHKLPSWQSPADIVEACAKQFRLDKWDDQRYRVECFIEKDALSGVFRPVCDELQIPLFVCRGYTSQTAMWLGGQRLEEIASHGQTPIVLHFGDHDPSGIDMTRDIVDRLKLFMGGVELTRLALNMDQIEEHQPPPNPTKVTDSRAQAYIRQFGHECWELDALPPDVLAQLVRDAVLSYRDEDKWEKALEREQEARAKLAKTAKRFKRGT